MKDQGLGQIFSVDFLVGVVVVLFIMTTVQVYHSRVTEDIRQEEKMVFHESLSSRTDTLLLFEGMPENWNDENIEILGFSTGKPNELNGTKLLEYFAMEDTKAENLLGFHGREFHLVFRDDQGDIMSRDGVDFIRGEQGWNGSSDIYTVERKISVEGSGQGSMRLVVW